MNDRKYNDCENQVNENNISKNDDNFLNQNIYNNDNQINTNKSSILLKIIIYISITIILILSLLLFKETKKTQQNSVSKNNTYINNIILNNDYVLKLKDNKPVKIICDEIKDAISYSNEEFFLTSTGDIYKFNYDKLYSNNKNCIKTEFGNNNLSYILMNRIYDKNNNNIYVIYEKEILTIEEHEQILMNKYSKFYEDIKKIEEQNKDFTKTSSYDFASTNCGDNNGEALVIKDYKVYGLENIFLKEENWSEIGRIPNDEKIIYLNNFLIKTDKSYWNFSITNEKECNKYVDIKCEKKIVKSSLTNIYSEILFATGDILIDKEYNLYEKKECLSLK